MSANRPMHSKAYWSLWLLAAYTLVCFALSLLVFCWERIALLFTASP